MSVWKSDLHRVKLLIQRCWHGDPWAFCEGSECFFPDKPHGMGIKSGCSWGQRWTLRVLLSTGQWQPQLNDALILLSQKCPSLLPGFLLPTYLTSGFTSSRKSSWIQTSFMPELPECNPPCNFLHDPLIQIIMVHLFMWQSLISWWSRGAGTMSGLLTHVSQVFTVDSQDVSWDRWRSDRWADRGMVAVPSHSLTSLPTPHHRSICLQLTCPSSPAHHGFKVGADIVSARCVCKLEFWLPRPSGSLHLGYGWISVM